MATPEDGKNVDVQEEIERYAREKEELRRLLNNSKILGDTRLHRALNIVLFMSIGLLFIAQLIFKPLSDMVSLELGLFLVSLKLIMMIEASARFNHFQFWILHSIEMRVNSISERLDEMERKLK